MDCCSFFVNKMSIDIKTNKLFSFVRVWVKTEIPLFFRFCLRDYTFLWFYGVYYLGNNSFKNRLHSWFQYFANFAKIPYSCFSQLELAVFLYQTFQTELGKLFKGLLWKNIFAANASQIPCTHERLPFYLLTVFVCRSFNNLVKNFK